MSNHHPNRAATVHAAREVDVLDPQSATEAVSGGPEAAGRLATDEGRSNALALVHQVPRARRSRHSGPAKRSTQTQPGHDRVRLH